MQEGDVAEDAHCVEGDRGRTERGRLRLAARRPATVGKLSQLAQLSSLGVSIWLDDLSRDLLASGNLTQLIRDRRVVGATNPTIFAVPVTRSKGYGEVAHNLAACGLSASAAVREIMTADVRGICDAFRETYERSGRADGRVSVEVSPELARDTEETLAEARDLWKAVSWPNLMVKIPATPRACRPSPGRWPRASAST